MFLELGAPRWLWARISQISCSLLFPSHSCRLIWHLSLVLICAQLWPWPAAVRLCPAWGSRTHICSCSAFLHRGTKAVPPSQWTHERLVQTKAAEILAGCVCSVQLRGAELFRAGTLSLLILSRSELCCPRGEVPAFMNRRWVSWWGLHFLS